MKEWKTIIVTAVVVLALLVGGYGLFNARNDTGNLPAQAEKAKVEQAMANWKESIRQLTPWEESLRLQRNILQYQQDIKELQLKAQAPPVIEGTFIPIEDMPEDVNAME